MHIAIKSGRDFSSILQAECLASLQAETGLQESCEAALASHQVSICPTDSS